MLTAHGFGVAMIAVVVNRGLATLTRGQAKPGSNMIEISTSGSLASVPTISHRVQPYAGRPSTKIEASRIRTDGASASYRGCRATRGHDRQFITSKRVVQDERKVQNVSSFRRTKPIDVQR